MYYSRSLHRRFDAPLPRYPSLVDDSEAITVTMTRRRLPPPRPPFRSLGPSPRRRVLVIAYGSTLVLGAVLWLVWMVLGADRDATGLEKQLATSGQSVVPAAHNRIAGGQIDEPPPVMRAEDLPILGAAEQRAPDSDQAPIARRRPR